MFAISTLHYSDSSCLVTLVAFSFASL